jgi:hypothetical protein
MLPRTHGLSRSIVSGIVKKESGIVIIAWASEGWMSLPKHCHNNQDYLTQKDMILFRVQLI